MSIWRSAHRAVLDARWVTVAGRRALTDRDRRATATGPAGVGVGSRTARDFSGVTAHPPVFPTSNAGGSSSRVAAVPRRHINARLMALVGATAVITAPATALLLELRPA
jgi:hypothetical protein